MKAAGVEEEHITGFEAHRGGGLQERLIFGEIGAEEQGVIEPFAGSGIGVGAGEHLQAAVMQVFGAECDPDIHEIAGGEGPVPRVLMPAGIAAEPRLLGHDAVVVGERHDDVRTQQLLEAVQDAGLGNQLQKDGIATDGLAESTDGPTTLGIQRFRGTGVVQVGFVFDITKSAGEIPVGDGADLIEQGWGDQAGHHEITPVLERRQFSGAEIVSGAELFSGAEGAGGCWSSRTVGSWCHPSPT